MSLTEKFLVILGRGDTQKRKGAPGLAVVGAIIGGVIASYLFPPLHTIDGLLFALTVIVCAVGGGAIGLALPDRVSSRYADTATKTLVRLATVVAVVMAAASLIKFQETGNSVFIVALVFFGAGAVGGVGYPNRVTGVLALFGAALASWLYFLIAGGLVELFGGIFFVWAAIQLLRAPKNSTSRP